MKRFGCLMLVFFVLFAMIGCAGSAKQGMNEDASNTASNTAQDVHAKNQIAHIGETVKYGDLSLTFDNKGVDYLVYSKSVGTRTERTAYCCVCIHLDCSYGGEGGIEVSRKDFSAFVDGREVIDEEDASTSRFAREYFEKLGFNGEKEKASMTSGRSSDLWVAWFLPLGTESVEFDYVNSQYFNDYGKVTFVVDIPQEHPTDDASLIGTWRGYDTDYVRGYVILTFYGNGRGCFTNSDDHEFEYTFLADHTLLIRQEQGTDIWHYHTQGNELILERPFYWAEVDSFVKE